jgi:hypothetical protein
MSCFFAQIGYTVRFEDVTSEDTRIKFLTDGMLLREAISDSLLRKYSCVILDEAHERTIHTDVLFGVVKAAQKRRKELGKLPLKVCVAPLRHRPMFFLSVFWAHSALEPWEKVNHDGSIMSLKHLLLGFGRDTKSLLSACFPSLSWFSYVGDCDVSYNGCGPVFSVFQWSPCPLPGGSAASNPDFLH